MKRRGEERVAEEAERCVHEGGSYTQWVGRCWCAARVHFNFFPASSTVEIKRP